MFTGGAGGNDGGGGGGGGGGGAKAVELTGAGLLTISFRTGYVSGMRGTVAGGGGARCFFSSSSNLSMPPCVLMKLSIMALVFLFNGKLDKFISANIFLIFSAESS